MEPIDESKSDAGLFLDAEDRKPGKRRRTMAQDALDGEGADLETQLKSLFSQMPDVAFDVTVQKYNPQTKSYPQITSYKDVADLEDIISMEEIGKQYGGGKYKLIVRYENESGKYEHWTRVFELDKAYDRFSQAGINPASGQNSAIANNAMPAGDLLAIMTAQSDRTMQMMMTMMQSSQNAIAAVVAAMAGAKPADTNAELLKEIIKSSKTDPAAQMQLMVQTMKDLKSIGEPECYDDEYECEGDGDGEGEEPANPDLLTELGKAAVPAIANIMGLNKQPPPQAEAGAA